MMKRIAKEKWFLAVLAIGCLGWCIWWMQGTALAAQTQANGVAPVRIHVIANSDSQIDQTYKLAVRDAVVEILTPQLAVCQTQEQAIAVVQERMPELEKMAAGMVGGLGYGAVAEFGTFHFPDRDYGEVFYPEGDYQALRLVLGEGAGKNWWCVLFPPLCFVAEAGETDTSATLPAMSGDGQQSMKINVKLKLLQ